MQTFLPQDQVYKKLFGGIGPDSPVKGLVESTNPETMQDLTTTYITTLYYSALSNLYLQGLLPKDIADLDNEMPRFKIAFERTYADFTAASKWLAENNTLIESSPAKSYYEEIQGMGENVVMDIPTAYSQSK